MSENFSNLSYFRAWCHQQAGFSIKDFQLDKDILKRGNKVYSEDLCVFVPREVNMFFSGATSEAYMSNGLPVGVTCFKRTGKYVAQCKVANENIYLGSYDTPKQARIAYVAHKILTAKILADKYHDLLDHRVLFVLENYESTKEEYV
jgi:hypothetical protein